MEDGHKKTQKGGYDVWVVMKSLPQNLIWENSYGGSLVDEASKVIEDSYGNFRIIGNTHSKDMDDVTNAKGSSDVWQIMIDKSGKLIGSYNFGGSDFDRGTAISEGKWGELFITGYSRSLDGDMISNQRRKRYFFDVFTPVTVAILKL